MLENRWNMDVIRNLCSAFTAGDDILADSHTLQQTHLKCKTQILLTQNSGTTKFQYNLQFLYHVFALKVQFSLTA